MLICALPAARRFQLCLFCYNKIIEEYNNTCPGCRTPYGTANPEQFKKREAKRAAGQAEPSSTRQPAAKAAAGGHAGQAAKQAGQQLFAQPPPPPRRHNADAAAAGPSNSAQQPQREQQQQAQQQQQQQHQQGALQGLPARAAWATAAVPTPPKATPQQPAPIPAGVSSNDEQVWPSLVTSTAPAPQQPSRAGPSPSGQPQQHPGPAPARSAALPTAAHAGAAPQQPLKGGAAAAAAAGAPIAASQGPSLTEPAPKKPIGRQNAVAAPAAAAPAASFRPAPAPAGQPQQPAAAAIACSSRQGSVQAPTDVASSSSSGGGGLSGLPAISDWSDTPVLAQVCSYVGGIRRQVCIPLHAVRHVRPYPQAREYLQLMQQHVQLGQMTTREAAKQLVMFLHSNEAALLPVQSHPPQVQLALSAMQLQQVRNDVPLSPGKLKHGQPISMPGSRAVSPPLLSGHHDLQLPVHQPHAAHQPEGPSNGPSYNPLSSLVQPSLWSHQWTGLSPSGNGGQLWGGPEASHHQFGGGGNAAAPAPGVAAAANAKGPPPGFSRDASVNGYKPHAAVGGGGQALVAGTGKHRKAGPTAPK